MTFKELIKSEDYQIAKIQIKLYNAILLYKCVNNLNEKQLAKYFNISKKQVNQILNGDADLSFSELIKISRLLGYYINIEFTPYK